MAKKKSSRASRKKNRKGAAGKKASTASTSERVNSKQDVSGNEDFRLFPTDESQLEFIQTISQNANHHIQNQFLESTQKERILTQMDAIYNKDLRKWVTTLYTMMATGELFSLGSSMNIIFDKLVFLVKNVISSTKKKDVLIDGLHLHTAVNLICMLMHVMNTDENDVLDLLESLTNTVKAVNDTHYASSGAAYVMCHSMINCYFHIREKKRDSAKPLLTIARSGILKQVLLHIHLSWFPLIDEQAILEDYKGLLYQFFGCLNSYTAELHKIFKEGTACHNALDAIVHGRIRPCKENEHMMERLQSLKKISDLSNSSDKIDDFSTCEPVDKQRYADKAVIDMARHTCAKCKTLDLERPLLVCAKCKCVRYCSKECQVTDWKKHKVDCLKKLNDVTVSKTEDTDDMSKPVFNVTKRTCAKCEKLHLGKKLLVCAKCKYIGYCSKECQVADWKNHKENCAFYTKTKFKNIDEITQNFCREHSNLIAEKVKAASEETGLDSIDLAVDLNFTSISGEIAPALRNPPEFEVLPASIFWNREKEKAPANHWFFKVVGGQTYYSDDDIKEIRQKVSSTQEKLGLNMIGLDLVFLFLNFAETPDICAVPSGVSSMGISLRLKSYVQSMFADIAMESSNTDDIPASERSEYEKDTRELLKTTFAGAMKSVATWDDGDEEDVSELLAASFDALFKQK